MENEPNQEEKGEAAEGGTGDRVISSGSGVGMKSNF